MRNVGIFVRVLALGVCVAGAARADMFDDGFKPCGDRSSTLDIVACVQNKTKSEDQRLNKAYAALQKVIDDGQAEPLKRAQRLWVQFRDANCGFYGAAQGTIRQVTAAECLRASTAQRANELEQAAKP